MSIVPSLLAQDASVVTVLAVTGVGSSTVALVNPPHKDATTLAFTV